MPSLLGLFQRRTTRQRITQQAQNMRRWGDSEPFDWEWDDRKDIYAFNKAMLDNTVYRLEAAGGYRETIFRDVFGLDFTEEHRITGAYNPVKIIVDCYQNVFRGTLGQEIKIDPMVDDRPVNPRLIKGEAGQSSPIRRLWRWSNLDTNKAILQEWAANLGTVGLRVVSRGGDNPRVYLQIDHPGAILDFTEDDRGNVTEIELSYTALVGELGKDREEVEVREVFTKDEFVREIDGQDVLEPEEKKNALGVCPYVILRHRDDGHEYGKWSYLGSEDAIHYLNWIINNQGESIVEYAWAQWFAAAGGNAPENFDSGRKKVIYVKTDPDTPAPIFTPLVPQVDQAGSIEFWINLIENLVQRQPELVVNAVKQLSGQSGETIAKLLTPAESKVYGARANYEHALRRAMQIGLSEGVRLKLWDLGKGTGTADAADATYEAGLEEFAFAERPALPQSSYDQVQQATAEQARTVAGFTAAKAGDGLVDWEEQMRIAHYTPEEIKKISERRKTQGALPTENL